MKILQVIDCFARIGGAEKLVLDLSIELKSMGNDIDILSIIEPEQTKLEFKNTLEKYGINTYFLNSSNQLYSLQNILKFKNFLLNKSYDIVHVHLFPAQYFCAYGKKFAPNSKFIFTEHSTDNKRRHYLITRIIDKWTYKQYDSIISISKKVEDGLDKLINKENSVIIPNGIKLTEFYNATPISMVNLIGCTNSKIKIITMCARFSKGKDYITLFKTLKSLPPEVHIICIGDGELRGDCETYCQKEKIYNQVHFLGIRDDVNRIFKASDAIVLSSEHEGFSLSMLEAMASGRPFTASRVNGIYDIIGDSIDLFPYKDYNALAKILLKMLYDNNYISQTVTKCLDFVKHYDITYTAKKHMELYNHLTSTII